MGLPRRLIEPESAITSVLLEYACKHSLADSPCFDSVISISEYEERHFDAFELYFMQAMCSLYVRG